MADGPKVEFALGSEVSPGHFFKSSFARSFVTNCRDTKSLDIGFLDNAIAEEPESIVAADNRNNNFCSLVNFGSLTGDCHNLWKVNETRSAGNVESDELDKLRKQCQTLTEENRRLQNALSTSQASHVQVIDNVCLQTQVDTLQWQLKQTEANRQMYRSLMEQVVRFLDRTRKSLDILHEKTNPKDKLRVPRSRSVHAVHCEEAHHRSGNPNVSGVPPSSTSRFTRAKSVTQISPSGSGFREFTWSVLRRNDPVNCTSPRNNKPTRQDLNKTHEGVIYRHPKQVEMDPDDIPPEKLSQEAFRLMRTVQSLLAMREPDLARVSMAENNTCHVDRDASLQPNFANSTAMQDSFGGELERSGYVKGNDDRGNPLLPGTRRSLDATSLNSGSSKTTETTTTTEEDDAAVPGILGPIEREFMGTPTSTPIRKKRQEKEVVRMRSKPATSVSSAEDESGFSSMSSFQEVGLPGGISPIKGCHTEVGLPEIPLDKVRHRRWTSTPSEIQTLFKRHSTSFVGNQPTTESFSVWV
ncbi:uncharacterized protein LOC105699254 [Orussus abietinus]|uniref:uncharacterized protein LOC105699254 n=1 Tax=Orussus abietinus TaxID=222816 RepID=UPI000625A1BE|nr:uncharacterized protein LOC105699254 [Orussus abietinus]